MGLKKYLREHETVRLKVTVADWEEAIRVGTDLLVETGAVETTRSISPSATRSRLTPNADIVSTTSTWGKALCILWAR